MSANNFLSISLYDFSVREKCAEETAESDEGIIIGTGKTLEEAVIMAENYMKENKVKYGCHFTALKSFKNNVLKLVEIKRKIIEKSTFEPGTSSNGWYQIYKDDLDSIL